MDADETRHLEVTHTPRKRLLLQWIDGGSMGFPSKWWLFSHKGGVRGAHFQDPCHARWDHVKGTFFKQGFKGVYSDFKVVRCDIFRHSISMIPAHIMYYLLKAVPMPPTYSPSWTLDSVRRVYYVIHRAPIRAY